MISGEFKTCKSDYCEICEEAHSCDLTCGLPCAGGDTGGDIRGHRLLRVLAEMGGWYSTLPEFNPACSLESVVARVREVDAVCCAAGDGACDDGIPASCPYRCGRVWTAFYAECKDILSKFSDNVDHFARFSDTCLDVDPVSMTLALYDAECTICGDGDKSTSEECDDGTANSNSPNAGCRTNCMLPACGDGVVDDGEGCDIVRIDGSDEYLNDEICCPDCQLPTSVCEPNASARGQAPCDDTPIPSARAHQ
jgi:hypothetical protein